MISVLLTLNFVFQLLINEDDVDDENERSSTDSHEELSGESGDNVDGSDLAQQEFHKEEANEENTSDEEVMLE